MTKKNRMRSSLVLMAAAVVAAGIYIRYQRMDIEIARFDYMMKVMKEEQMQNEK